MLRNLCVKKWFRLVFVLVFLKVFNLGDLNVLVWFDFLILFEKMYGILDSLVILNWLILLFFFGI